MLCLEVTVNGERYCLAGADDVGLIDAYVASRFFPRLFGSGFDLHVRGVRVGKAPLESALAYWGKGARHLNVGDVVTIRLLESNTPDVPTYVQLSSSAREDGGGAEPELFGYSTRIPDGIGGLLVWVAIAILGLVLLYVTPHG